MVTTWRSAFLFITACFFTFDSTNGMTIEKQIFDAAPNMEMFDNLHIMPGNKLMVMAELDLLLTVDQYRQMYWKTRRNKRKAVRDLTKRWPECIVNYEIMENLAEDRAVIQEAMTEWSKYTCITFRETSDEPNRVQFKDGGGCFSKLGMAGGIQELVLARGCRTMGVVAHEIGHAVGFYHEHMRPDRDKYIFVNYDVIPGAFHQNYKQYSRDVINTYDIPYDYTSLMHYGATILPDSIVTLDPMYQDQIGQREGFSFKDIKLANVMYNCAEQMGCKNHAVPCPEGGFRFYKEFKNEYACQCWCNSGDISDPLVLCTDGIKVPPPPNPTPTTTPMKKTMDCMDVRQDCKEEKRKGYCMFKMEMMMDVCAKTCGLCGKGKGMCMDHSVGCRMYAGAGHCTDPGFRSFMKTVCPASCGLCSKPPDMCALHDIVSLHRGSSSATSKHFAGWHLLYAVLAISWAGNAVHRFFLGLN